MRTQYVDERLRTVYNDEHKARKPRGAAKNFPVRLLPLLALVIIAAVPLFLLTHTQSADRRELSTTLPTERQEQRSASLVVSDAAVEAPDLAEADSSPPAPPIASTASASSSVAHPPYSAQGDCRREYDRDGRGDGFARCGSSCCRSSAGIACYYKADMGLCDRFIRDGGGGGGGGGGGDKVDEDDDVNGARGAGNDAPQDVDPMAHQLSKDDQASHGATAAATPERDAAGDAAAAAAGDASALAAAALTPASLERLVPMIRPQADSSLARRPRMLKYPQFNLTWTRGAPPPRSDGWSPTEVQRARLPLRDLKEQYYASCAVVGSSGTLRRSGYGRFIDAHEMVMRFNGAPAGGGYAADVGSRTTLAMLADVATSECVDNKAKQPTLDVYRATSRLEGHLLQEPAPGWRSVSHCQFYPEALPPPLVLFLPKRGGVRRLLDFSLEHPTTSVYIRSDALADEVDAQVGAYADDTSHPTSGFNGISLALHVCETIDLYGFGSPREKFYSPPRTEKSGAQHLYRTEMRWMLGLERRFPGRVRLWP